ncbi:alginate lyase family protein [Flagellimonas allohymeniacidonis]|uniref:alginate lyase family protein n=1 Tax=Flagellimonas allohymeniacidonis TaxID=2517819 RepID=UPI0013EE4313|nr:alginate lyase family protein [Allomuricauda hymeniacidonis]
MRSANKLLAEGPFSVTQKTQIPPSGDKHDYISIGPYWWPDPEKSNGLPWINKDGQINPITQGGNTDNVRKSTFFQNVYVLSLAYFFSEKKKYAKKAEELLRVWFVDSETKMNPNLNFAQGVPGRIPGRSSGIIEFSGIRLVITSIEILDSQSAINKEIIDELKIWFADYLHWLQTSEGGIEAKKAQNNHGTWYDVQEITLLLYLERFEEARLSLEMVKTNRIATQIGPDGAQPKELIRTKALHYSTFNLHAFTLLAHLAEKNDMDLWNYQAENGASVQKAYAFLIPYVTEQKEWDYQQITNIKAAKRKLLLLFGEASSAFKNTEFCEIALSRNSQKDRFLDLVTSKCSVL